MQEYMKVAVMTELKKVELQERKIPEICENEVLVKIENVGICGSDLHYFEHGRIGDFVVETPFVLGHEAAGEVVKIGQNVSHLQVGDKVALEPGKTCGKCEACKIGKYNLCNEVIFFATPPVDGVFQEYVAHEAALCFKLPENVSTMEGALIEPLAVGIHAAKQGGAGMGQTAVVTGAGCIGLVSVLALKAAGVSRVIVVDVVDKRLEKAVELGADFVINGSEKNAKEEIMKITNNEGHDLGIETAGADITASQLIKTAKKGATIVQVGYSPSGEMTLPMGVALDKELRIETVFRYRNIYKMAIEAVASGTIDVTGIVSNEFEIDNIQEAMTLCMENKRDIVKGVIKVS